MFPEELMLVKLVYQDSGDICHYWYFLNKVLSFDHMYKIDLMIYE